MNVINKTRFIHFRNVRNAAAAAQGAEPTLNVKGGATIAWKFDENGDILVGAPAICSINDNYDKTKGRDLAEYNLGNPTDRKPLALVVPKAQYMTVLDHEVQSFQGMKYLTQEFRNQVTATAAGLVADDPFNFVNIGWFEQKIRQVIVFHENQVFTANGKVYGKNLVIEG